MVLLLVPNISFIIFHHLNIRRYGGVQHIYVDSASATGNVYVKCPDTSIAVSAVNALHGRWFAGKVSFIINILMCYCLLIMIVN